MIKILLYTFFFFNIAISEVYQDRLRVYIDNSIKNFQINEKDGLTNIQELNKLLINFKANEIQNGFQMLYLLIGTVKSILIDTILFILVRASIIFQ